MVPDPLVIPTINQYLPNQIRVIGTCVCVMLYYMICNVALKKVVKSFNSKQACTSRVYEYLLPTYVFAPFEVSLSIKYIVRFSLLQSTNLHYRING